ncbi:hypothetical protein EMGBS15_18550 [Filimonas sp.]|nr:hypothetical protein EMGBS15_18550 [Filimonas sp.]
MKALSILFISTVVLLCGSCKQPKSPVPSGTTGDVTIHFINQAGGAAIAPGALLYTNTSGNTYSVDILKYYVSQVVLVKEDGAEFKLNNYDLIDAFDVNFSNIIATKVPNGNYTSMKFIMGVDSARNHTGAQDGDLDPANNMIWTWSTGYIFFKHEGTYKNAADSNKVLQFHLGTDKALSTLQIPIALTVSGSNKTMNIVFELNKMYNSPSIDFNIDNIHMSTSAADDTWIANMVSNSVDAFTFKNVE